MQNTGLKKIFHTVKGRIHTQIIMEGGGTHSFHKTKKIIMN